MLRVRGGGVGGRGGLGRGGRGRGGRGHASARGCVGACVPGHGKIMSEFVDMFNLPHVEAFNENSEIFVCRDYELT